MKHYSTNRAIFDFKIPVPAKYTHPATHPASMIQETTNKHFMTDAERTKLSDIDMTKYMTREEIMALFPKTLEISIDQEVMSLMNSYSYLTLNGTKMTLDTSYMKINVQEINTIDLSIAPYEFMFSGILLHADTPSKNLTINSAAYGSYKVQTGGPYRSGNIHVSKK